MSSNLFSSQLLQDAAAIARKIVAREGTRVRWATVTSTDPLLIRYDGETEPSIVSPQTIAAVAVGQRVAVAKYKGQALVLGTGGGASGLRAQVVRMERGERTIATSTVTSVTGYTDVDVSGEAMYAGNFSIGINWPGYYEAFAAVRWEANSVGIRQLRICEGNDIMHAYVETRPSTASPGAGYCAQAVSTGPIYLTPASAPIRARVYQNSGETLSLNNHSAGQWSTNFLRMTYLGDRA